MTERKREIARRAPLVKVENLSIPSDIVKRIAMDIGKETAAYIEVMYPEAVKHTSSTFLLSVRNHIYNEIMGSLELTNEQAIVDRLNDRKKFRREWKAAYKKIRTEPTSEAAAK